MTTAALRVAGLLAAVLSAACADGAEDPATAPPGSTFSVTLDPNTVRMSQGGSAVSVATVRGGAPPATVRLDGVPNAVSIRVASTNVANVFKLIIVADASAVPGTYSVGVRCTVSDREPDATTALALTIAKP